MSINFLLYSSSSTPSSPSCLLSDGSFLRTLASSLIDFNELSSVAALNMLLEVSVVFFTRAETSIQQEELLPKLSHLGAEARFTTTNHPSIEENLPLQLSAAPLYCHCLAKWAKARRCERRERRMS